MTTILDVVPGADCGSEVLVDLDPATPPAVTVDLPAAVPVAVVELCPPDS